MSYNFNPFKQQLAEVQQRLSREFEMIRAGRPSPAILDGITVDSYGSRVPLKHLGVITIDDVRTLRVTLWDQSQFKSVETAINTANLGVSLSSDGTIIRLVFPELTEEKRKLLIKLVHEKLEESRISIRKEREKVWNDIQAKERAGEISEDDKFRYKEEMQKIIDEMNRKIEEMSGNKELALAK